MGLEGYTGVSKFSGSTANPQVMVMLRLDNKWPDDFGNLIGLPIVKCTYPTLIRFSLQMDDGGDVELLDLEGKILSLHYMGPAGGVFAVNEIYIAEEGKKISK